MALTIFSVSTNCPFSGVKIQEVNDSCEYILVCKHSGYSSGILAEALGAFHKSFIPNWECQFVRDLNYTQCPLFNLSK